MMNDETYCWDAAKEKLDYLCKDIYKIDNHEWMENLLSDTFKILNFLNEKKSFYKKSLNRQIDETIQLFELVNEYEKNRGYKQLSKQAKLLKNQYLKYKSGEDMKSGLKRFFDDYSGEQVPLYGDILVLVVHNIKQVLIFKHDYKATKAKEIAYDIVKIILNDDKKFTGKVKKEGISIVNNNEVLTLNYYPPTNNKSIEQLFIDYIPLINKKLHENS